MTLEISRKESIQMTLATQAQTTTAPAGATGQLTEWTIDPAHTDVLFSAKHMMVTTVRGKFHDVEGTLQLDESNPTNSSAEIRISAASLATGNGQRDGHLRSADFFDAETHPTIAFRSTSIEQVGTSDFRISGDLTIQETTRPIVFDATFLGFYTSMQGTRRVGLSARTMINRKDWGLGWNVALETGGWLVGENVTIEVEIAADEAAPAATESAAKAS
jgi:polyisoprenoid-binding protein YceI